MNKKKRISFSTKKIAYTAIFIALGLVAKFLSLTIGAQTFSIFYTTCVLAGIFLGPVSGLLVGGLSDLIASLMQGGTLPLITLGAAMMGFIPGLISKIPKIKPQFKIALSYLLIYIVTTVVVNSLALYPLMGGNKTFWAFLVFRLSKQTIVVIVNIFLTYLIYFPLAKVFYKQTTPQVKTLMSGDATQDNIKHQSTPSGPPLG